MMHRLLIRGTLVVTWGVFASCPATARAQTIVRDVEYARPSGHPLCLDFYQPKSSTGADPLIIWVHGGAWRSGSRDRVPIRPLTEQGFAIASVDYRLSPVARFPAQIHDIKAAIRFLRRHADQYGLDRQRFVIAGASAGRRGGRAFRLSSTIWMRCSLA